MKLRKKDVIPFLFIAAICIFTIVSCRIEEINQPEEANTGDLISIGIVISDTLAEEANAHKLFLAILVPEDWSFESGVYASDLGNGAMEEVDAEDEELTADHPDMLPDSVFTTPEGMKWILLLTGEGYAYDQEEPIFVDISVDLRVGQTEGEFGIGYYTSKNTGGMQGFDAYDLSLDNMITVTGTSSVEEVKLGGLPESFSLHQNFPNPFNPTTVIRYDVKERTHVRMSLFDVTGRVVATLVNELKDAGSYEVHFTATNLPSGMYLYRMETESFVHTQRMTLVK